MTLRIGNSLVVFLLSIIAFVSGEDVEKKPELFPLSRPLKKPFHISSYARDDIQDLRKSDRIHHDQTISEDNLGFSYKVPTKLSQKDQAVPYGRKHKQLRDNSSYGPSGGSYAYGIPQRDISQKDIVSNNNFIDDKDAHQVIAGIPDLSDPCFRRYANTIIVNAQPYERRSTISLINCKSRCLESQISVYSCRSFVYDNLNQVCDLFAHVGDQSPAKLLRFQTRDYFEPTSAITCATTRGNTEAIIPSTATTTSDPWTVTFSTSETTTPTVPNTVNEVFREENSSLGKETTVMPFQPSPDFDLLNADLMAQSLGPKSCKDGQIPRFLKTQDFALDSHDDVVLENTLLDDCIQFCMNNWVNGSSFKCNSFDYTPNRCILSSEVAVPLGNGQLKQQLDVAYYEKVCVDEKLANECPIVYNRFPQKILVGFAETVIDAPTLQECFDNCLNSQKLYGFRCISGMYYFEEAQLNCILNTEDRTTQADLFANENTDLVDYFETGCNRSSSSAYRRFASPSRTSGAKSRDFIEPIQFSPKPYEWTGWSECNEKSSKQTRTKMCAGGRVCGQEERSCSKHSDFNPEKLLNAIRKANCVMDKCCKIWDRCDLGIMQDSSNRMLEWCSSPC